MNENYVVYCHTNKTNGKKYFGITNRDPQKRWGKNGCRYLKRTKGIYQHPAFARAILKYGWDGFDHEIICSGLSYSDASNMETELIAEYKTNSVRYGTGFGYNCTDGGDGCTGGKHYSGSEHPMYGKHHSEEARKKMSLAQSGENNPMYGRSGVRGGFYGWHHTEEHKAYIREVLRGKNSPNAKRVRCVETGKIYDTVQEAADENGLFRANISACCRGKHKTSGGFHWEYY